MIDLGRPVKLAQPDHPRDGVFAPSTRSYWDLCVIVHELLAHVAHVIHVAPASSRARRLTLGATPHHPTWRQLQVTLRNSLFSRVRGDARGDITAQLRNLRLPRP